MLSTEILPWNDPALTRKASSIDQINDDVVATAEHMTGVLEKLGSDKALGVAANQIGSSFAMFTVFTGPSTVATIVNPRITESSGSWNYREGCLSLPGMFWWIARPKDVLLTGTTLEGDDVEIRATTVTARLFQHEMDHMNGVLILDRLPKGIRKQALRKLGG